MAAMYRKTSQFFCNVNVNFQPKKNIISNCDELDKSLNIAFMIKGSIHGCDYIYGRKEFKKKCLYIFGECITKDLNFTDLEIQSF